MSANMYGGGNVYGTLERTLRVLAIREAAADEVADLTAECNDYQIIFCAAAAGIIVESKLTIDDLSDKDLINLYFWLVLPKYPKYA